MRLPHHVRRRLYGPHITIKLVHLLACGFCIAVFMFWRESACLRPGFILSDLVSTAESVLHPRTPPLRSIVGPPYTITKQNVHVQPFPGTENDQIQESMESFAQYGASPDLEARPRGLHYRLENTRLLNIPENRAQDSILFMVVLNNAQSWGPQRTAADFFELLSSFDYTPSKISLTILTSIETEFYAIKRIMGKAILQYARLSLLYREDLCLVPELTRLNRHQASLQNERRRMLARYRNYALISTLQPWHQHVIWIDADVHIIPSHLVQKMVSAGLDIVEPLCMRHHANATTSYEYDLNAWVGRRKRKPPSYSIRSKSDAQFIPGDAHVQHLWDGHQNKEKPLMALDSVGGTMLYVKADIHRQGVLFPHYYIIGSEWDEEGYDGIETEGLCYSAHFLGFKCWGMPHEMIWHS